MFVSRAVWVNYESGMFGRLMLSLLSLVEREMTRVFMAKPVKLNKLTLAVEVEVGVGDLEGILTPLGEVNAEEVVWRR